MSDSEALAVKLGDEGARLAAFMESLGDDQWTVEVYTEGSTWTVRSVLAHLMTSERAFVKLLTNVQHGGPGVSDDFSIDRYNASQQRKAEMFTPAQLLQEYRAARAAMVNLVADLDDADLDKQGRHPFLGVTTMREMVKMIYIHNQIHYRDIRRALKSRDQTSQ